MKIIRLSKYLALIVAILVTISIAASFYFFHVAQVREKKSFINSSSLTAKSSLYGMQKAFDQLEPETRYLTNRGHKQVAWYLPAESNSSKTVVIVHGFVNSKANMKPYAILFRELGYNVLMPDNEAHGKSQGDIIGYGWNDRKNLIAWTNELLAENAKQEITYFGLSMGGATVMMASGEPLPKQVKAIIEDCGYSSVWEELKFQAKEMYQLPAFPLLYQVSALSKIRAGFSYQEASAVEQLKKNKLPVLFIHGNKDNFVPTSMVYDNYKATKGPKSLYIAKGAKHAKSFESNPEAYKKEIKDFLSKYQK
ncbi:alpha/beta hydrolase [Streptococcus iniae]|uniref:Alpha/beta hydrolase n=1 Tax=Streptococcus iniae TaxID=1346 RepID=A0ABM5QFZ2_STRIN|nr:alpha/beta hydrolase [Streptococcus iniae]AGM98204.1 hypothetical protein K710_0409 [Streptococcus iniae SF1]AHY15266.1 alpha/beta hydrolase [Streptococcus iniae]AHY17135.1 alpha/beta hydrolase [Streptococcus iniae]AJG25449.1 alpha/beta hydrolase [Streptococcus iniae]APD31317.1 alpha/beta hydrolase [Streptococcus iniae]